MAEVRLKLPEMPEVGEEGRTAPPRGSRTKRGHRVSHSQAGELTVTRIRAYDDNEPRGGEGRSEDPLTAS